jgi:ergothioneine biosynthesis protein EgtB
MIDIELSQSVNSLVSQFKLIRQQSLNLCSGLSEADMQAQSMSDASPLKWHLAHTTWAFESFLLKPLDKSYKQYNADYDYLFNSYYNGIGKQYPRPMRGLLTRPSFDEIINYRQYVDNAMCVWLDNLTTDQLTANKNQIEYLIQLCFNHEQQHQELILTDLKHLFSFNPQSPSLSTKHPFKDQLTTLSNNEAAMEQSVSFSAGLYFIGQNEAPSQAGIGFCFDNETPAHQYYLESFKLDTQLVSNADYVAFIEDGGYSKSEFWLSEAWQLIQSENRQMPLYWRKIQHQFYEHSLLGLRKLPLAHPVSHISYFEANAYANWKQKRLPTEQEWEVAAITQPEQFRGLYNQLWQWTSSSYSAYPGFKPTQGVVSEYNGKFMLNQYVLRGGSIATPQHHIRATYRNFFAPSAQWQYSGIRLAESI